MQGAKDCDVHNLCTPQWVYEAMTHGTTPKLMPGPVTEEIISLRMTLHTAKVLWRHNKKVKNTFIACDLNPPHYCGK